MSRVVIVIPIYKATPDYFEVLSFMQCLKVLQRYKICIITFDSLDVSFYTKELLKSGVDYTFEYFDKSYFQNIEGYNRLLISKGFYKRFEFYDYILVYQLDAYVFRDDLEYWCNKGYDYIGAPWFDSWSKANTDSKIIGVGNGGFSLRKVSAFLKVYSLNSFYKIRISNKELFLELKKMNLGSDLRIKIGSFKYFILRVLGKHNNTFFFIERYIDNEDIFWSEYIPLYFSHYKVANVLDAISFSFEANPNMLFKKNGNKLPFGCHAWWRYDLDFWSPYILSTVKQDVE